MFERELNTTQAQGFGTIVILVLGLGLGIRFGKQFTELSRRETFGTASGVITSLSEPTRHGRKGVSFDIDAEYSFGVNGTSYTGTSVGISSERPALRQAEVDDLRAAFDQRRAMVIRFNPASPDENYLECSLMDSRSKGAIRVALLVSSGLLLLGLVFSVKLIFW